MTAEYVHHGHSVNHLYSPRNRNRPACTPSRYTFPCEVCAADIVPGDLMFPFVAICALSLSEPARNRSSGDSCTTRPRFKDEGGALISRRSDASRPYWAHRSCAVVFGPSGVPPPPECRHWSRLGRCPVRDAGCCAFRHEDNDVDAVVGSEGLIDTEDLSRRYVNGRGTTETTTKRRWRGKRRVVRNGHKNSALRIFLIKTYGVDYLRGGVVLEVAGGKGELSWELLNLVGVECLNVDPRPMSLQNAEARWRKGMYEPRRTGPVFQRWLPAVEDGSSRKRATRRPAHLRCLFEAGPFVRLARQTTVRDDFDAERWLLEERENAKSISWTTRGLQQEDEHASDDHDFQSEKSILGDVACATNFDGDAGDEITDVNIAKGLLQRTILIIGLHPDQAAGDIVDLSLELSVPFCIVPCCVYSDMFTKRRLADGTLVKTYDHLVQWLTEKHPDSRVATLGIEGKNKIIFTLPQ